MARITCILLVIGILFRKTLARPPFTQFSSIKGRQTKTTNWTQWEFCADGTQVLGISLMISTKSPDTLKGFRLVCNSMLEFSSENENVISASDPNYVENYRAWKTCAGDGVAVGIQQRVSSNIWSSVSNTGEIPDAWKLGVIDLVLYCEDLDKLKKVEDFTENLRINPANWRQPFLCGWGEVLCAVRAQFGGPSMEKMLNIQTQCCPFFEMEAVSEKTNRMLSGSIISSKESNNKIMLKKSGSVFDHHFSTVFDSPYYFKWKFCATGLYVTGIQIQHGRRGVGLLCSDMTRPKPRTPEVIQMNGDERAWEMSGDDLSEQIQCDGVAIGFQVQYGEKYGIEAIRLICSFTSGPPDELKYVESRFKVSRSDTTNNGEWQEVQMCRRNEAICGFKAYTHGSGEYRDLLEHMKVKCCEVPEIADVCFPTDRYELLVECDATGALAETTCTYTQSEGMSISHTKSASEKRDLEFHDSLGREWTVVKGSVDRESKGISSGDTSTNSSGQSTTDTENKSAGTSTATGADSTSSQGSGATNSSSTSFGTNKGGTKSESRGGESGSTNTNRQGQTNSAGSSNSHSNGTSSGISQSGSRAVSTGSTAETSESSSEGTSTGTMKAQMLGKSSSRSSVDSTSRSNSESHSDSQRDSKSSSNTFNAGITASVGVEAGYSGFGVSASVRTNFETSFSYSGTSGSEKSNEKTSSRSSESSNSRSDTTSSDTSSQDTNQETSEQSKTKTSGSSNQVRQDSTNTIGKEENSGKSNQVSHEQNKQKTHTSDSESSNSQITRTNTEDQISVGENSQTENGGSLTVDNRLEKRNTTLSTNQREISKGKTSATNFEIGHQQSRTASLDQTRERTGSKSMGNSDTSGKRFSSGFNWDRASTSTWNMERSTEVRMTVPAGMRTRLYQAVGHCAFYTIKTTLYKRIDNSIFHIDPNPYLDANATGKPVVLDQYTEYMMS